MVIWQRLAQLLLPAEPSSTARAVEAPTSWEISESSLEGLDAAVWGRAPLLSGTARALAARAAVARERSLAKLRRGAVAGLEVVAVHRWPPANLGSAKPRTALRNALLGGALAQLSRGKRVASALDRASTAAGFSGRPVIFRPGSGGSVRVTSDDRPGDLLRVGAAATPADPGPAADALDTLEGLGLSVVPRLVDRGSDAGASWSVETIVVGRAPARVDSGLLMDLASFCSTLPEGAGPPASFRHDLDEICRILPDRAESIRAMSASASAAVSSLPSVARHGDLWSGNLLVGAGGELVGVLDWDAWDPAGVPGADLLHAYGVDRARREKLSLGRCWARRPWRDEGFASAAGQYWSGLGVRPSGEVLDAVGMAWWANQIAKSLQRLPHLASHSPWIESNVDSVLRAARG